MKKVVKFVALFFALILIAGQGLVAHAAPAKLKVVIVQLVRRQIGRASCRERV